MAERVKVKPGIWRRETASGVRYEIAYRDSDGRQRRQVVEGGQRAAETALATVKSEMGRGRRVAPVPRLTFDVAADRWFEARCGDLRPATCDSYTHSLAHLRRALGRRRLDDLSVNDVTRFIRGQRAAGYRGSSVRSHLVVLRQVFAFAQRRLGYAGANPVELLERRERPSMGDESEKRVLAADELRNLLDQIPPRHRPLFELVAETGARKGEALGLVWREADLDACTVTFTCQLGRSGRREPLKTPRSRRCVEITPALAASLRAHRLASAHSGEHDLVFSTPTGAGLDHRGVLRVLESAAKRAGLGGQRDRDGRVIVPAPTLHALRHSHGSALIAAGWDIEEVSARLGHADVTTTLREYTHAYDAARRSAERRERLVALYGVNDTPSGAKGANIRLLP